MLQSDRAILAACPGPGQLKKTIKAYEDKHFFPEEQNAILGGVIFDPTST